MAALRSIVTYVAVLAYIAVAGPLGLFIGVVLRWKRGLYALGHGGAWLALKLASPDFLAVDRAALGRRWVARARERIPVYSWTIRNPAEREQARVHADAFIWEADGRP